MYRLTTFRPKSFFAEFFKSIFLIDLIKGLIVTFNYQRPSENITEQYPKERPQVAERFRGAPRLNIDPETGETLCIACKLCQLACPIDCIEVGSEKIEKKNVLTTFTYDIGHCMYCGLCEDACPTPALELTQDFELATYTRDFIWDRERLETGPSIVKYKK